MSLITKPTLGHKRAKYARRTILKAIPLTGAAAVGSRTASAGTTPPETLPLPTGFQPEGIVTGRGSAFFVGSLAGGAIYRGDLRTGEGEVLVRSAEDRVAVGLSYDPRGTNLFVAGGPTGRAFVYDAETGETAADYTLTDPGSFVNDVVVTAEAAFFTDSFRSVLYRVPLGASGRLPEQGAVDELSLGGDFEAVRNEFNTNGIDAPPDGNHLIVVNSTTGMLYRVDPDSGDASEIDLGGETLTAGDGILLDGNTLYVVRNRNNAIAVVELEPGASEGEVVREITDPRFDVPTTIAEFGSALYAVNARFGVEDPENAEYTVVRVPKRSNPPT
ncbi:SMP-30/gluconolactonase/LRE family protein [Halorarum salinum]|uniref:SMP-30/gluconolactonase/LRE family protein n=1 Tax=Halorarum salinum TaxID=2743089 RepID=A0A7D5QFC5_9EURY|nr:SMP-30/gluconolactonase/LRE family protein [Halobaculum salinum]QLG63361.1 SMP-30/gluconolactonase/LRE family protein [Halobaculum salinum]